MEFTADRLDLLELAKKAARLANENSPVEALKGICLESDEDAGEVSMIATNYEAAIFLKEKAAVSRSGKLVINAKLLTGMLTLLNGEQVTLAADNNKIKVSSERATYTVAYLPGEHYPKPVMPFPDETVRLSGICGLAKKTVFAVSKDNGKPALQCVCLKVKHNCAHAAACDGARMILVKSETESAGVQEFLLPAQSFRLLASISTDEDVYNAGVVGNEAVFIKRNLLFAIKLQTGVYIDTNVIVQSVKPQYKAVTKAGSMFSALELMSVGPGAAPVNLLFTDDAVRMTRAGESGSSVIEAQAKISGDMPESGFFYNTDYLLKLFHILTGTVKIEIDSKGMMLVRAKNEIYVQAPVVSYAAKAERKTAVKNTAA